MQRGEIGMTKRTQPAEYECALQESIAAMQSWQCLKTSINAHILDRMAVENLLATVPRGLYRHFKNGLYVVETVVYDVNGIADPEVDYTALYGDLVGLPAGRLLYGKDAFLTPVDRPNDPEHPHVGRRFVLIRKLSIMESAKIRANAKHIARGATPEAILQRALRTIDPRRAK
jgi:hypothetical protein